MYLYFIILIYLVLISPLIHADGDQCYLSVTMNDQTIVEKEEVSATETKKMITSSVAQTWSTIWNQTNAILCCHFILQYSTQ